MISVPGPPAAVEVGVSSAIVPVESITSVSSTLGARRYLNTVDSHSTNVGGHVALNLVRAGRLVAEQTPSRAFHLLVDKLLEGFVGESVVQLDPAGLDPLVLVLAAGVRAHVVGHVEERQLVGRGRGDGAIHDEDGRSRTGARVVLALVLLVELDAILAGGSFVAVLMCRSLVSSPAPAPRVRSAPLARSPCKA